MGIDYAHQVLMDIVKIKSSGRLVHNNIQRFLTQPTQSRECWATVLNSRLSYLSSGNC